MTDTTAGEMPAEPAPPILSAPGVAAEIEPLHVVVPKQHGDPTSGDEGVAAPVGDTGEVETEVVESFDPRVSIPETLGPVRRAVLEGLIDSEGALSVAELHALMPLGTPRGTTEAAILREYRSGRITRTSPGHYVLAPVQPSKPAKPVPPPAPSPEEEQVWGDALERWFADPETWDRDVLGPRPDEAGRQIPADIVAKGVDRDRKRRTRRQDREAAQARQAAADQELRTTLLRACNGNHSASLQVDDLSPIKAVLKTVPLDRVIMTIRQKVDRRCYPSNPPLASWRDPAFLRAVAEDFCRVFAVPGLVREWGAAGKAPAAKATAHQDGSPVGVPPAPDMAMQAPAKPADAPNQVPPEPENASTVPPANGSRPSCDSAAEPDTVAEPTSDPPDSKAPETAAAPVAPPNDGGPVAVGRDAVLAAFNRNRAPPSPQPAPPQPRPAVRQVERPPERQAEPISREGWEELVSGYVAGNVNWNPRRLGAPPGDPDCRAPRDVLRSFGL
jgi:hypothetical protein